MPFKAQARCEEVMPIAGKAMLDSILQLVPPGHKDNRAKHAVGPAVVAAGAAPARSVAAWAKPCTLTERQLSSSVVVSLPWGASWSRTTPLTRRVEAALVLVARW